MDRRLIERTIEIATQSQAFGPRALCTALDSSPLWGLDESRMPTNNLLGHALKKVLRVIANQQGRELAEVAQEAGAEIVCATSLKAALDRDWDKMSQREVFEETGLQIPLSSFVLVRDSYDIPTDNEFIARKAFFYTWATSEAISANPDEHITFSWSDRSLVDPQLYWQSNKDAWHWIQEQLDARPVTTNEDHGSSLFA